MDTVDKARAWDELAAKNSEIKRLRKALGQMLIDPPPTLDEPDTDGEVLRKIRAIAYDALFSQ